MKNKLGDHPMSYDLHKPVTKEELEAGLRHGKELKQRMAKVMKEAGEEYESRKQK